MKKAAEVLNGILKFVILYSIVSYLVEVSTGSVNSHQSHWFFLFSERVVAGIFTLEYLTRLLARADNKHALVKYIKSPLGMIDLLAILPFWAGFYVPLEWLGIVRTLRILRLLKFFRYDRPLQFVALAFYRSYFQLKPLFFPAIVVILFSTVAMYEVEKIAQPEAFGNIFDSFWFTAVTITTVGYGDMSPVTILGRVIAMITFISALALFAGIVGVLGSALTKIIEEQQDPNNNPLFLLEQVKAQNP